jgi:hypothetical protein
MQRIEHRKKTLARHAKRATRAVNDQLVDEDLSAATRREGCCDRGVCHGAAVVWAIELGEVDRASGLKIGLRLVGRR